MSLNEMALKVPIEVVRDCSFSYAAKIPTRLKNRIVPCGSREHIAEAVTHKDIAGIVTTRALVDLVPASLGLAVSEKPVKAIFQLHEALCDMKGFIWEHFPSRIHPSANIHPTAVIAPQDVVIGENTYIGPGSVIQERSIIGADCHVGVGVVIGLDALEIFEGTNPRRILRQAGGVYLERGVTVLAKCTLVRATFGGFTRVGEGSILDVLIYLAHDCQIGKEVTIVACAEVSGRCDIADGVYVGPNSSIRNGVKIGKNARVSMGAVVTQDVETEQTVSGNFAVDHRKWLTFVKGLK